MKDLNEENACNAFIEILEKVTGVQYEKQSSPDEQNSASPEIDYILISKDGRSHKIAVEHTIVESFEGQIPYGLQSYDLVEQINLQCQGMLPTDRSYTIVIPPPLSKSLKRKWKTRFVKEMALWACDTAKTLTEYQQSSRIYDDHKVTLICDGSLPEMNGNVGRGQERPKDSETLKRERFRRAVKEKLPKLVKYKRKGITTALLLEDISGILLENQARWKDLPIIHRLKIRRFVDYMIILASNNQKMIVGKVWKEKRRLYSTIPQHRKFSLR